MDQTPPNIYLYDATDKLVVTFGPVFTHSPVVIHKGRGYLWVPGTTKWKDAGPAFIHMTATAQ